MMRLLFLVAIGTLLFVGLKHLSKKYSTIRNSLDPSVDLRVRKPEDKLSRVRKNLTAAKAYASHHRLNERYALLVDFSKSSGEERLFLIDLDNDSCILSSLVSHGRCNESRDSKIRYSNRVGSGCSSPGHYRIGITYIGKFGRAYKLHGMDSTNNNAYARYVVLHGHECVPDNEIFPEEICLSDGCPMLSPKRMIQLHRFLQTQQKDMLLWILP